MSGQQSGLPCPKCDSSDAVTLYPAGDAFCFSCETFFPEGKYDAPDDCPFDPDPPPEKSNLGTITSGVAMDVPKRGLAKATLEYYGVKIGYDTGSGEVSALHFPVFREGQLSGWKIKDLKTKSYTADGNTKQPQLFGQDRAGAGGKLLIITEGEEDCMSAYQLLQSVGKNYKVVSLPNGANTAAVKNNLEWLENFETIILNLDNDEKGKEAAKEIAKTLTPGKCKMMDLPANAKDTNQFMLNNGTGEEYLRRLNNAKEWRPDGIVMASLENIFKTLEKGQESGPSIPYPWSGLNQLLYGIRDKELVTWTAGTGIGKSAVMREIEHHLLQNTQDTIGVLALEESVDRSMWGVIAVEANLPLAIREEQIKHGITDVREAPARDWIIESGMADRMIFLDHFGMTGENDLMSTVRFMIKGLGCKHIVLDHLSIVVSGMDVREDERKTIDRIMTQLRQLTEETKASLHLVAHLRRVEGGRSHEQGMEVGLSHLRGSQAIAQLSDAVVAMERNQQADDPREANLTRLRVLKNRYAGMTGLATNLAYDRDTGRLTEIFNVDEYLAPSTEEAGC